MTNSCEFLMNEDGSLVYEEDGITIRVFPLEDWQRQVLRGPRGNDYWNVLRDWACGQMDKVNEGLLTDEEFEAAMVADERREREYEAVANAEYARIMRNAGENRRYVPAGMIAQMCGCDSYAYDSAETHELAALAVEEYADGEYIEDSTLTSTGLAEGTADRLKLVPNPERWLIDTSHWGEETDNG